MDWNCRFEDPTTEKNSRFESEAARRVFFAVHDVKYGNMGGGILDRNRNLTWPVAEKEALMLFERKLAEHYRKTIKHEGEYYCLVILGNV